MELNKITCALFFFFLVNKITCGLDIVDKESMCDLNNESKCFITTTMELNNNVIAKMSENFMEIYGKKTFIELYNEPSN